MSYQLNRMLIVMNDLVNSVTDFFCLSTSCQNMFCANKFCCLRKNRSTSKFYHTVTHLSDQDICCTVKEADAFLKNYLAAFPNVSGYMDKTIADAKANGYVSTLFGRRRALPELASSNFNVRSSGERMARNTPIQGTAADVIKLAMVRVWKRLRDEKMASRLILTVHDELIVEAPEAEAEQAARILREEMEGCVQYAVPLSTDVHAGKNWLEAH